jgi:SOS-response transcriptional repressor LexA/transcriptional regulator with XRE-family HTH domain
LYDFGRVVSKVAVMNTMGTKIRRARVRLALTLDDLAQRSGISKAYLSLIETGRLANPPSDEKLRQLAEAIGLPANELLGRAHVQRIPPDVRAVLDELIRLKGKLPDGQVPESRPTDGRPTADGRVPDGRTPDDRSSAGPKVAGAHGLPLNLDAAYRSGVLQELADRNGGNVEPVPMGAVEPSAAAAVAVVFSPGDVAVRADAPARSDLSIAGAIAAGVSAAGRRLVPVVNKVSAGYPKDFTDLSYPPRVADAYIAAPGVDDPDAFAARVSGDSMAPKYAEGDIVVFSPAAAWKDGADCFVRFEDGQTTFKRVYADWTPDDREALRLQPRNERYQPRVVPREQINGVYRAVSVYRAVED